MLNRERTMGLMCRMSELAPLRRTAVPAWALVCLGVFGLCLGAHAPPASAEGDAFIVVCPVDGDILDGMGVLVDRVVRQEAQGAEAIVFVVDTFGGKVDSAIEIAQVILESPIPTIAFITGRGAISAGALIAYACDHIVMAPGTNIGASTPVIPGVETSEHINEKSMSFLRAKYRALGEANGHNPLLGEAMVDPDIELYGWRGEDGKYAFYKVANGQIVESYAVPGMHGLLSQGAVMQQDDAPPVLEETVRSVQEALRHTLNLPTPDLPAAEGEPAAAVERNTSPVEGLPAGARLISPAGKLLTLTAREAQEFGLIRHVAATLDAALEPLGFAAFRRVEIEMTWAEAVFSFLSSPLVAGLLLLCGVGGIYIEFRTPGLGWPGVIGAACLALFFGSRLVIGIAEWLDVLLVMIGIGLLAVELLVLPGFGLAGISGVVCLVAGLYLSLTRVPIPQYTWDFMRLRDAGVTMLTASLLFFLFVLFTWKVFPHTRLARGLVLAAAQLPSRGYVVQTEADMHRAVGLRGVTVSMLRPAGRGRFGSAAYDIVTRGEFVEPGRPVEIIQAEGNRYVVRELARDGEA